MALEKRSWTVEEIAGFEVIDETGEKLGVLADVIPTGANDVFVVQSGSKNFPEILIPALVSIIIEIDVPNKKILVNLPPGLKDVYEVK